MIGRGGALTSATRGRVRAPRPLVAGLAGGLALAALLSAAASGASLPGRDGVVLYRKKCGGCHRPYAPSEIRPEKWQKVLPEMLIRAKLSPDESERIRRYLEPDIAPSHGADPSAR